MKTELRMDESHVDGMGLARRLDEIAWSCILILTGAVWLAPAGWAPEGTWLAGFGLIALGHEGLRLLLRLGARGFGLVVGTIASIAGIGRLLGYEPGFVPVLLVALGAAMILRVVAGSGGRDGEVRRQVGEEGR